MKIIQDKNAKKYIDQDLYDYINKIWLTYDNVIPNDSNIFFAKNTTVNRMITDYCQKNISRVIKKEKADNVIIEKINLTGYPQFWDNSLGVITYDDTKEVVYGIYNLSAENQDTIEQILDFVTRNQNVVYTNQNKLNESLNNGFIIDNENYTTLTELINSNHTDNHIIAINMLSQSDLKSNWEWILYLLHGRSSLLIHDKKSVILNYIKSLPLKYSVDQYFGKIDTAMGIIQNKDVKDKFCCLINKRFNDGIRTYLNTVCGTDKIDMLDFKLKYIENT